MKQMMEGDTGREMLEPQEKSTRFFYIFFFLFLLCQHSCDRLILSQRTYFPAYRSPLLLPVSGFERVL